MFVHNVLVLKCHRHRPPCFLLPDVSYHLVLLADYGHVRQVYASFVQIIAAITDAVSSSPIDIVAVLRIRELGLLLVSFP